MGVTWHAGPSGTVPSYGDMTTNRIQPFRAIPLLALARLEFKHIRGYELIFFAAYAALALVTLTFF